MDKYKICPTCGHKNQPTMIECVKCETDLTGVSIAESYPEQTTSESKKINSVAPQMIRRCECGTINAASARKCEKCGEDISDFIPESADQAVSNQVESTDSEKKSNFTLLSLDGTYRFLVEQNTTIIGRENCMSEYLSTKPFVSRKHAELLSEVGKIWIKNLSKTNKTFINNNEIEDDKYIELFEGDIIGLGGKEIDGEYQNDAAFFTVRIETCI